MVSLVALILSLNEKGKKKGSTIHQLLIYEHVAVLVSGYSGINIKMGEFTE